MQQQRTTSRSKRIYHGLGGTVAQPVEAPTHDCALKRGATLCRVCDLETIDREARPVAREEPAHAAEVDTMQACERGAPEVRHVSIIDKTLKRGDKLYTAAALTSARTAGRREGVRSVQEQTAAIVRAALELLESVEGSEPFTAEKMRAFKRIFGAEDVRAIRTLPDAQG